jgi:hypothetical protein
MENIGKRIAAKILSLFGHQFKYGKVVKKYVRSPKAHYFGKKILSLQEGNDFLLENLKAGKSFFATRLGSGEIAILYNFLLHNKKNVIWDKRLRYDICFNAGVFPDTEKMMERFCEIYIESIPYADFMGVWYNEAEDLICEKFCPQAVLAPLESLEPYYFQNPWSKYLAGKKVLVIHPFEDSVAYQYQNRQLLFQNNEILPEFDLQTLKSVQSLAFQKVPYATWEEALWAQCEEIDKKQFDIALIGAGAYGLPLGAYIRKNCKTAIHLGGASQILFGIKGERWYKVPAISSLFNEHWKHPFPHETPEKHEKVDNGKGAYW